MLKLKFTDPTLYTANMNWVPERWRDCSFDMIDFTGKERLREILMQYFDDFEYDGKDSLLLHGSDYAFQLFVALYREIASRVAVNSYRFLEWPTYVASLRRHSNYLSQFYDTSFLFILDLAVSSAEQLDCFSTILNYCFANSIRLFVVTRLDGKRLPEVLPEQLDALYREKILRIGVK